MTISLDHLRWQQVKALLEPALELSDEERARYLEAHCADPELHRQVKTLLDALSFESEFMAGDSGQNEPGALALLGEGSQIGDYRLLKKIGEGGMGEVFLATQEAPIRRTVALKLIRPGLASSRALLRFDAERQALALMSHPNIARIYDAGEGPGGRPYVVMEYLVGRPITEHCDADCLSLEERLRLFREVLEGVRHAHRRGVIHRDLKPNNILVTDEDRPVPKIIDFGIAKVLEDEKVEGPERLSLLLTAPGQVVGTPDYMSPEQAEGASGSVDIRSDVYSLGVVLYELLCGHRPLELPDLREVGLSQLLEKIHHQVPAHPSERLKCDPKAAVIAGRRGQSSTSLQRELRGDASRIVMKALAKDPADRYESAGEMAADIGRYLRGEPLLATSAGAVEQVIRWVRRYRLAASVAGLFLISLIAGIVGTTSGLMRAQRAEKDALAQAERARAESVRARDAAHSAQQITDFLISVLDASDPTQRVATDISLREVLDHSARRIRDELIEQPRVQARLMLVMSHIYKSLGVFEQALSLGEDALALFRKNPSESHDDLVDALLAASEAHFELGEYETCLGHLREALTLVEQVYGPDDIRSARLLNNLGMVYRRTKQLDRARNALEKALQLRQQHLDEHDLNIALTLNNLGLALYDLGETRLASAHLERSLRLHERALGADHPELSYSLNNLAMVHADEGRVEAARALFERAVEIDRGSFGADHPYVATGLFNLGYLAKKNGDCRGASVYFSEARVILQAALPADHWKVRAIAEEIEDLREACP